MEVDLEEEDELDTDDQIDEPIQYVSESQSEEEDEDVANENSDSDYELNNF